MDAYVIPPVHHLDLANYGDRFYVLAHLYLQYPHYRDFFKRKVQEGKFVTLDNSAAERSLVTEDKLLQIVADLKPNEVIAPDYLFDSSRTLAALGRFVFLMKQAGYLKHTKIFACPQGKDESEWITCYEQMLENEDVFVIGLSKIAVPYCWGDKAENDSHIAESRNRCVAYLEKYSMITKPLHCLGQGHFREFEAYQDIPLIRSTDSCYQTLAAIHNIDYTKNFKRVPTSNSYFGTKLTSDQYHLAVKNINFFKEYIKFRK